MGIIYIDGRFVEGLDKKTFASIDRLLNGEEDTVSQTPKQLLERAINIYGKNTIDIFLAQQKNIKVLSDKSWETYEKPFGYSKTKLDYVKECEQECEEFLSGQQSSGLPKLSSPEGYNSKRKDA